MKNKLNINQIKEEIIIYSKSSMDMEEKRETNTINQSVSILTAISILLVALFTLIFELLDRLPSITVLITILGSILLLTLLTSMFFSIKAQWCYKKEYKKTAIELMEHINAHIEDYSRKEAFQDQTISDISAIQKNLADNNDKRVRDIIVSFILLYTFLFLLFVFGIIILIVL